MLAREEKDTCPDQTRRTALPNPPETNAAVPVLLLFDLSIHGHHPAYIQHLVQYGLLHGAEVLLKIVVSPAFLRHHADVVSLAAESERIEFVAIDATAAAQLKPRNSSWNRLVRSFQEWQLLCQYARLLKADHCLMMYFDTCQVPFILGQKPPCPISGIYFRPSFHYPQLMSGTGQGRSGGLEKWYEKWHEKWLLNQVLRQRQLHTLFNLDPFVGQYINRFYPGDKTVTLPDPVEMLPRVDGEVLRQCLGIESERQVFLLFGALNGRKGIYQLLEAIALLPPSLSEKMCLLLVGQTNDQNRAQMTCQIEPLREKSPIQIITHYEFVPAADVPRYFQLADVVLAPYPKHVGMSGVLLWAAAAQKPVLSCNYGLMGELVRQYRLGITVDANRAENIAQGLVLFLQSSAAIGDRQYMQRFTAQNTVEKFADTIFKRLLFFNPR